MKTYEVWLKGRMIGDVALWPGGWLVWDDTIETYLYPPDGKRRHFRTRREAVGFLVGRHEAISQLSALYKLMTGSTVQPPADL